MKETLRAHLKSAMKEKNTDKKLIIQNILGEIQKDEIKLKRDLNEQEQIAHIKTYKKNLEELKATALENDASNSHADAIKSIDNKLEIIKEISPQFLSEDEILSLLISDGATKGDNVGKIIGSFMKNHGKLAEGKLVKKVVEENFGK